VGIAKDPLQPAAGPESWEGEQRGESLDTLHDGSGLCTARSLSQISNTLRAPANQAKPQAGCMVGEEDALSFTHFNLH